KLLEYSDLGFSDQPYPPALFEYRWVDEGTPTPKLVIKTKLSFLADLIASESTTAVSKGHIREVLLVLQRKLDILEDNRIKTQGSDVWDFTLKLWDTSTDRNLSKFDQLWEQYKATQGRSTSALTPSLSQKLIQSAQKAKASLLHNLTLRPDSYFIDTQEILSTLFASLSRPYADAIISIVGPGGIGKTTLALEVAYRCLAAVQRTNQVLGPQSSGNRTLAPQTLGKQIANVPKFEVIVFASAQSQEFLGPHLSERWQADRTLKDIIREVLKTVDYIDGIPFELDAQIEYVNSILKNYKTLLILDNLETTENPQRLLSFVRSLPQSVKVILTSRTRFGVGRMISLEYLSAKSGCSLIEHQAKKKLVALKRSQTQEIYRLSGGLPLAMAYSIGYLSVYDKLPELGTASPAAQPSEMARYCVEASIKQIHNESAFQMLMAITLFSGKFSAPAANYIAGLPHTAKESGQELSSLYRLSLVNKLDSNYYSLHSLTKQFIRSKLDKNSAFKQAAQGRWIEWYSTLVKPFSENWQEWHDYSSLEPEWNNVRALVNWCIETEEYESVQTLWDGIQDYTIERGYWAERKSWMDELIKMARAREDTAGLAKAMFFKGQTLLHVEEADTKGEAFQLLCHAWELCPQSSTTIKLGLIIYLAISCLKRNLFEEARNWLKRNNEIEDATQFSSGKRQCIVDYYTGEIALRQKDYATAENSYRAALSLAETSHWQRLIAYSKGWLGLVLMHKGELDESEELLQFTAEMATQHKDRRLTATTYHKLALLTEKRAQIEPFINYATLAKEEFERLGMTTAANQMKQWLKERRSS
ncbi:MAG: NB-ARC domain-containing protein, partial [Cyanobacteria bacterium P01_F01_bin.3]